MPLMQSHVVVIGNPCCDSEQESSVLVADVLQAEVEVLRNALAGLERQRNDMNSQLTAILRVARRAGITIK